MRRTFLLTIGLAAAIGGAAFSAAAMPASPMSPAAPATVMPGITLAAGGCGIGMHPGPRGICRRNYKMHCTWHIGSHGHRYSICH